MSFFQKCVWRRSAEDRPKKRPVFRIKPWHSGSQKQKHVTHNDHSIFASYPAINLYHSLVLMQTHAKTKTYLTLLPWLARLETHQKILYFEWSSWCHSEEHVAIVVSIVVLDVACGSSGCVLWLCVCTCGCGCVCGCVFVVVCLWLCVCGVVFVVVVVVVIVCL